MAVLTYSQLNTACLQVIQPVYGYELALVTMMELMYLTGCRPIEAVDRDRWFPVSGLLVEMDTAKNGSNRQFSESQLPDGFFQAIQDGRWLFPVSRLSQAQTFFVKNWPYPKAKVGQKDLQLYAFRYRYIKKLKLEGVTNLDIAAIMGWSTTALVSVYNGAEIVI